MPTFWGLCLTDEPHTSALRKGNKKKNTAYFSRHHNGASTPIIPGLGQATLQITETEFSLANLLSFSSQPNLLAAHQGKGVKEESRTNSISWAVNTSELVFKLNGSSPLKEGGRGRHKDLSLVIRKTLHGPKVLVLGN